MKTKLLTSDPKALNPPIDRMINNFISDWKHTLLWVSQFTSNGVIYTALITYK